VAISYAAVLVLFRLLVRRGLGAAPAFALALLFALSPYYFGASFALLTDNLAILFGLVALDRLDRFGADGSWRELALGCLALAAAVLTRQSLLWLALVAAFYIARDPSTLRRKAAGAALLAAALVPLAALVVTWDGLVPPGSDPASCGICDETPGRDALTLRTVGFTIALLGVYATVIYGPALARRRARALAQRPAHLTLPVAAGVALLLLSPLLYQPTVPGGRPADAGYLWQVSDRLPELLGSSLLFWILVPAGALAVMLLAPRTGLDSLPVVYLASFLIAALPVGLVYQKYFDPFVLIALALFARPADLTERSDYAGVAVLAAGFVAYALSFAG
jgi:hypothetical protein